MTGRKPPAGSVRKAVERDLTALPKALATSALAASALVIAAQLDDPHTSATSKSMCARELREHLDRLRELAPPAQEKDELDDLTARRNARRTAGGTAP